MSGRGHNDADFVGYKILTLFLKLSNMSTDKNYTLRIIQITIFNVVSAWKNCDKMNKP